MTSARSEGQLERVAVALIVASFVVLGAIYSVSTPIFEASDELWHYPVIHHLVRGGGLPVQDPSAAQLWRQEGSQPPLYYALGALLTAWIDTDDLLEVRRLNPHADIGVLRSDGNVNMTVHTDRERFPYQGVTLAVHLVRWLSVLMGAVTVALTYHVTRAVFVPRDDKMPSSRCDAAVLAAALVAFNPMFLFISGSVNNDNLVVMLSTLALWLILRLDEGRLTFWRFGALGLVIGLAVLSKVNALALIPLAGLALLRVSRRGRTWRPFLLGGAAVGGAVVLVVGWWFVRNGQLYGDPLGLNMLVTITGARHPQPTLWQLAGEWQGFLWSFWGLFGGLNVPMEGWMYVFYDVLSVLACLGLLIFAWRCLRRHPERGEGSLSLRGREILRCAQNDECSDQNDGCSERSEGSLPPRDREILRCAQNDRRSDQGDRCCDQNGEAFPSSTEGKRRGWRLLILVIWPVVVFVALVRWTLMTPASQGRLMFSAIASIGALLAVGLAQWMPGRYRRVGVGLLAVVLFILAVLVPFQVIAPAYARPQPLSPAEIEAIPNRLSVLFSDEIRLMGYQVGRDVVSPGDKLPVTLYWEGLAPLERDYSVFIHLLGEHDLVAAQRDTYPGQGMWPTSLWKPGQVIADTVMLDVPRSAYTPDRAQIEVGVYDFDSGERLPVLSGEGQALGDNVRFNAIEIRPIPDSMTPNPVRFNFEGRLALVGYRLDRRAARPGEQFVLTLYWEALQPVKEDYTVFTHVLGEQEAIWAQKDSQPQSGAAPTSKWQPGTLVEDQYELRLRTDTPPDVYEVEVGMYRSDTGRRLGVLGERGRLDADHVVLTHVRVVP